MQETRSEGDYRGRPGMADDSGGPPIKYKRRITMHVTDEVNNIHARKRRRLNRSSGPPTNFPKQNQYIEIISSMRK